MAAERSEADAELAARLAQLTPQQFRVLLCLAENTVKGLVAGIMNELECDSRAGAAVLVKCLEAEGVESV